jgi:phenylalanyl-tRNA synthetase beta subunit
VLIECAYFSPRGVRRSSRRHGLHTESSHRFERGVDRGDTPDVLAHAAALDRNVTQTAVTAPRPEKWRDENPAAVQSILAQIAPVMARLGYPVD